jgi:predicted NBD/HSP70 family sugar kinase
LAIMLDQSGVRARATDLAGATLADDDVPPGAAGDTKSLQNALRTCVRNCRVKVHNGPLRAVAISVANPVHPDTHEVTALPDSPFPEGLISPRKALGGVVAAPILVDNDVNLAALAEHRAGAAARAGSFGYVYIGAGLGLGLYIGDQLIRGARGLAGEIGYLPGAGSHTLAAEMAAQGFGRPDAPSNDVTALLHMLDSGRRVRPLSQAVARAIASICAVVDPELVVLGGPIGTHPALLEPVRDALAEIAPAPIRVIHGELGELAPLHGAVHLAVEHARDTAITV